MMITLDRMEAQASATGYEWIGDLAVRYIGLGHFEYLAGRTRKLVDRATALARFAEIVGGDLCVGGA